MGIEAFEGVWILRVLRFSSAIDCKAVWAAGPEIVCYLPSGSFTISASCFSIPGYTSGLLKPSSSSPVQPCITPASTNFVL